MLILKSQVVDLFDKAGLSDFTIGRNNNNCLGIVGPCGQELVQVTNFPVGARLTGKERDIAIDEHIIPTLTTFEKPLKDLIAANEKLQKHIESKKVFLDSFNKRYKYAEFKDGYSYSYEPSKEFTLILRNRKSETVCIVANSRQGHMTVSIQNCFPSELTKSSAAAKKILPEAEKYKALNKLIHDQELEVLKLRNDLVKKCSL